MSGYLGDEPVISSYLEAYLSSNKLGKIPADAGSRTSQQTAQYGYGPAHLARRSTTNFVEGSPTPVKTVSVLQRPTGKVPSAKNSENIDVQHERDKVAFQRRAKVYHRHADKPYHHHAPRGSILTTFEQGHIVDRGRRKSTLHEARGVYDPVVHDYRIDPAPDVAAEAAAKERRTSSAPHKRLELPQPPPPQHERLTTPFEHKLLQFSRGSYNPLTHEYIDLPEPEYVRRKEKEFDRVHGLGSGLRRVPTQPSMDPIKWEESTSVSSSMSAPAASCGDAADGGGGSGAVASGPAAARRERPMSAPSGPGPTARTRKSLAGPSWGTYNPLTHEWKVPPANPEFVEQDTLLHKKLGMSGSSTGRTQTPRQQGVYNPILNTWTVPPANPRLIDGLSFQPATLFSRPTPATIRM